MSFAIQVEMVPNRFLLLLVTGTTKLLTCYGIPVQRRNQMIAGQDAARYAIVLDAGSTKTKLTVYKIAANAPPLDVKDIQLLGGSQVKPGLAFLACRQTRLYSNFLICHSRNTTINETPIRRHNERSQRSI